MRHTTTTLIALALIATLSACTSKPAECPDPTPVEAQTTEAKEAKAPDSSTGIGHLEPAFFEELRTFEDPRSMTLHLSPKGEVSKIVLVHGDEARVPEAVRALAEKEFPEATVTAYEFELYADGTKVHEVEIKDAEGVPCEVSATEDGTMRYTECEVTLESLPEEKQAKIKELTAGGTIDEIEQKEGDAESYTGVTFSKDGHEHYLRLEQDGTVSDRALRLPSTIKLFE